MPYDLHITRAGSQLRSAEFPIPQAQWEAALADWPRVDDLLTNFYWRDGQLWIYPEGEKSIAEIAAFAAERLGARLLGGDDEEYLPDGSVVWDDPAQRPDLPARPA
ncbi:hypothetical protein KGA66_28200 [Actinocrinis puniceicyclus]|uniref:Uncharacterized protein n=1 Tax=Actinocrinis puniceicyclus TaxID=977794 RepID=A0A8J7WXK4_9ACTN|nr:hypothetical protein [Actinocrinis puniceicyclus]MBS2966949.1 hypothetical protein [Actinocrinis puniceicyclus]